MELDLSRNDLISTTTAAPRTLAVFPPGANKTQKFVVGDSSGIMQCISVKPSGITVAFKTLPHPDQRVTGLSTGKGKTQRDKCFSAHGNKIKGTNKKGKEFFKFATNHTEAINSVFVNDTTIHAATDYSVSEFQDGQDKHLYMAPDRINCTDVVPLLSFASFNPVLACQDRTLRILTGDRCLFEAPVPGAATCVKFVADAHDPLHLHPGCKELLYGTENGHMGQLMADTDTVRKGFQLAFDRRPAAVTALFSGIDLTKDGVNDILVGRDDGTVELYDLDLDSGELVLVCSHKFGESINTLDGGFITNGNVEDYLVQTFSGKVIALCQPGGGVVHTSSSYTSRKMEEAQERKATYDVRTAALQADILQLKEQVENERSKYQQITAELVAVENANEMKHSLCLVPEEACYRLSIEAATPIIAVALHADLALELIDVENSTAILSITPPPPEAPNQTLATYRCQDTSSRLEIRFRVQEGLWGSVRVFPVPKNAPKTCETVVYRVKPLSYHCAASNLDTDRPLTTLTISGAFSMGDVHAWVEACLPDVAKQPPGEAVEKQFQNAAFGSILLLRYRAGEAQFQSDALHVLSILREVIMELATAANQQISVAFGLDAACVPHFVRLLWPKLEYQRSLARRVGMIDALQELRMQDGDTSYLSSELQSTLSNTEKVQKEFEEQPKQLSYLHRVVRDSYALFCSLQGHSAPGQRMPHLQHLLDSSTSTLQDVVDFVMA